MGHLTNPISLRLGKKIWWNHQYNSLSKRVQENFFFFLTIFFDRFLSSFFSRKKRYEFEGTMYFGNRLVISQKIYLYILLYDQKTEKTMTDFYGRFTRGYKDRVKRWMKRLKRFHRGCCKFMVHFDLSFWKAYKEKKLARKAKRKAKLEAKAKKEKAEKAAFQSALSSASLARALEIQKNMSKWERAKLQRQNLLGKNHLKRYYHRTPWFPKKKKKVSWKTKKKVSRRKKSFYEIRRHRSMILFLFRQVLPKKGKKFHQRFFRSYRFRWKFIKEGKFVRPFFYKVILSEIYYTKMKKFVQGSFLWFSLKGSLYKLLEKYFRDRNQLELVLLSLRTATRGNPVDSMLITPKFLGEFITKKLDQKHKLRDIIYPILKALGRNPGIAGFKMTCSGRFSRADRATYQWHKHGHTTLSSLGLPILYDYSEKTLPFGVVSLKIWMQYRPGEFQEYLDKFNKYIGIK